MQSQDSSPAPASNQSMSPSASTTSGRRRTGNARDLTIGLGYVLAVGALIGWGGYELCSWKSQLDEIPPLNCYNPVWCHEGTKLAFLQTQPDANGGNDSKCSMWTTDSHNQAAQLVVKDLENSYRIVGWFDNDDTIVLQSHQGAESHLVLMVVSLSKRTLSKYSFNDPTIAVVGSSTAELYLQRKLHNNEMNADEVELLTWSPSTPQLTKITSIPDRPAVEVNINNVVPDSDALQFAMVLRYSPKAAADNSPAAPPALAQGTTASESLPEDTSTNTAAPGQNQFSVWLLDRSSKQLNWTNFSAIDPLNIHTAWSDDNSKISCVAVYPRYADVALYQNDADLRYVRLHTYAGEGDIVPQIRSTQSETYLISNKRVMLYNFDSNANEIIADASSFKLPTNSLSLAKGSDAIALTSHVATSTQIFLASLKYTTPNRIDLAGKTTPPTLLYELATALQCANKFWLGK